MTEIIKLTEKENGYCTFLLRSNEVYMIVSNMGCQIRSIFTRDRNGSWGDIVLGAEDGEHPGEDGAYMGSLVGRVANRIARGEFSLNGREYSLAINNGPNHLHGGITGFDQKLFDWKRIEDGLEFQYISRDMEEGYPGTLTLKVQYHLDGNRFRIQYGAVSDADTLINITNHMYFHLNTDQNERDIRQHILKVDADLYMPADENCLVTGEKRPVAESCFDFREAAVIGERMDFAEEQIRFANGFDHAFVLNQGNDAIHLMDEESGRYVSISTTEPMVHVYTGNYLSQGAVGKSGVRYPDYYGIALETEKCPDSIHVEEKPEVILKKGLPWTSETIYQFGVGV